MEIKFQRISGGELTNLSFCIPHGQITGITGQGKSTALKLLDLLIPFKGSVFYDGKKPLKKELYMFRKELVLVTENFVNQFQLSSIYAYFAYYIKYYRIEVKNVEEKMKGALKIVGLDSSLLKKDFVKLSSSELKKVQLALAFLSNPKVILLDEPFIHLDEKEEKKIFRILEKLKDKFGKTIVLASNNSEILYQYTSHLIVLEEATVLLEGATDQLYFESDALRKTSLDIPEIVSFIQLVEEKKGISLDHRKDVRDLIKDIYRNV